MSISLRKITHQVLVGNVKVGGGAPIVVQSMTNTDTANVAATVNQIIELSTAGSEIVRVTVNTEEAAKAVAAKRGIKNAAVYHPVRVAVSGRTQGPSLFHMLEVLGRDRSLQRIRQTIEKLSSGAL